MCKVEGLVIMIKHFQIPHTNFGNMATPLALATEIVKYVERTWNNSPGFSPVLDSSHSGLQNYPSVPKAHN